MIDKIKIEWWRIYLKYWLYRVEKDDENGLPNIYNLNKTFMYSDRITELYLK